jgi:hypothetical protein
VTGRDYLYKWGVYGVVLLLLLLLETVLLTRFPVAGVCPMLFPLAVVAVGLFESPLAGAVFGVATGLLHGAFCYENGSFLFFGLALAGFLTAMLSGRVLKRGFLSYLLCSLGGMVLLDGGRILFLLLEGERAVGAMLRVAALEIAYSLLFTVPVYLLIRAVFRRVGGASLA